MLLWLNGDVRTAVGANENYARELQELFCLGAGRGYGERDVRELARALTGFRNDWADAGASRFRYDQTLHDARPKRIYGKRGRFDWQDGRAAGRRATAATPRSWSRKLWGYFIPTPPPARARRARSSACTCVAAARCGRWSRRSCATRTSTTRDRRMAKPPVVQAAGMLRAVGRGIDTDRVGVAVRPAGQMLFVPPNVSGWDDTRWLDTATFRARWLMATRICEPAAARRQGRARRALRARRARVPRRSRSGTTRR